MLRELNDLEIQAISGGMNMDDYRTSDNVRDETCNLQNYFAYLDAMVRDGKMTQSEANVAKGQRVRYCMSQ